MSSVSPSHSPPSLLVSAPLCVAFFSPSVGCYLFLLQPSATPDSQPVPEEIGRRGGCFQFPCFFFFFFTPREGPDWSSLSYKFTLWTNHCGWEKTSPPLVQRQIIDLLPEATLIWIFHRTKVSHMLTLLSTKKQQIVFPRKVCVLVLWSGNTADPWTTQVWTVWVHLYVDFVRLTYWKKFWRLVTIWKNSQTM